MIGPFEETLDVTPHPLERSNSTFLTMLVQQLRALWDLGFYFSSNESILVNEIPVFYDVSQIVPISAIPEIDQNSAITSLQQLFPPSVALLNQSFHLPLFFKIEPFLGLYWQVFSGVSPIVPAVLSCQSLGIDELQGEFSFVDMPKTAGMEKEESETPVAAEVSLPLESDRIVETPLTDGISPKTPELHRETTVELTAIKEEFHPQIPSKDEENEEENVNENENENVNENDKSENDQSENDKNVNENVNDNPEIEKEIENHITENEIKSHITENENEIEIEKEKEVENHITEIENEIEIENKIENKNNTNEIEIANKSDIEEHFDVETVETIDTHSKSSVVLSPKEDSHSVSYFSEPGFSKEFHSESSPIFVPGQELDFGGSQPHITTQVNALFKQDLLAPFHSHGFSSQWPRSQDTFDEFYGPEEPRELEEVEAIEEEHRNVSLGSLLSDLPGPEGTLRRRGRLLYHGDEDEDVRNAVCLETVAGSMKQIVNLLGMEGTGEETGELRESVMGLGKQGETTTMMEMIPEEIVEGGGGEENMWNTGCGKD